MSLQDETEAAHRSAALAQAARCGVLRVTGADRQSFLHSYTTREIQKLTAGTGCTTAVSTWKGTVLDVARVIVRPDDVLLVSTFGRQALVKKALEKFLVMVDVRIADESDSWRWIEATGPAALDLAPQLADLPLNAHRADGRPDLEAIAVRIWGPLRDGVGWLVAASLAEDWRADRLARGATPISPEAQELLRIASGAPRFGQDMDEETNVWEARLDASVSMDKGCYLGQEVVARLYNYQKVQRYLMGVQSAEGDPPPVGAEVRSDDHVAGKLTSVARDPQGGWQGLTMVGKAFATPGRTVQVGDARGQLVDRPYWRPEPSAIAR